MKTPLTISFDTARQLAAQGINQPSRLVWVNMGEGAGAHFIASPHLAIIFGADSIYPAYDFLEIFALFPKTLVRRKKGSMALVDYHLTVMPDFIGYLCPSRFGEYWQYMGRTLSPVPADGERPQPFKYYSLIEAAGALLVDMAERELCQGTLEPIKLQKV